MAKKNIRSKDSHIFPEFSSHSSKVQPIDSTDKQNYLIAMENATSTVSVKCFPTAISAFIIIVVLTIVPFHILMVKVLVFDLRLGMARHKIMLCLSISDTMQLLIILVGVTVVTIFNFSLRSLGCNIVSSMLQFTLALTLVISSLSIIALSVERYVACVYSFHLHRIFTRERMMYAIIFTWILGVICGALSAIPRSAFKGKNLDGGQILGVLAVIFILPTSAIISIIQFRLLMFSRKKFMEVGPSIQFGCQAEIADFRKKQIKVAFVAGIVAVAYMICMLPLVCLYLHELIFGSISSSSIPVILRSLAFMNNFADPYIYGLGMTDTRRAIRKNLKKLKALFRREEL